jgi:hypothetical protein
VYRISPIGVDGSSGLSKFPRFVQLVQIQSSLFFHMGHGGKSICKMKLEMTMFYIGII